MNIEHEDVPLKRPAARRADVASLANLVWESDELFRGEKEIMITHGDKIYRLRKTRNGKLILQK